MGAFDASRSFVRLLALVVIGTKGGNDVALLDAIKFSIVWFAVETLKRRAAMRERVVRSVEQIFVVPEVRSASSVVRTSKAKHTVFHDQLLEIDLVLAMRANCTATLVEVRLIKFLAQIKVDGASKPVLVHCATGGALHCHVLRWASHVLQIFCTRLAIASQDAARLQHRRRGRNRFA